MRIIVASISIFLMSLFADFLNRDTNQSANQPQDGCPHCSYIQKMEPKTRLNEGQPRPYIHDADSTLMIFPILENDDNPGNRYIQDIKFIYKDLHYCSDQAKITFINRKDTFEIKSMPRMSCKITAMARFSNEQTEILAKVPTQKIIIENLVTDNIYEYVMKDSLYFVKAYKLQDYKGDFPQKTDFWNPKKSGHVK